MERTRKKRAWDGERMHYAEDDTLRVEIDLDGSFTATYKNGRCIDSSKIVLMDASGVRDDNGREIYEGDLVNVIKDGELTYRRRIVDHWGYLALRGINRLIALAIHRDRDPGRKYRLEVTGNIYENPDMEEI